jgi:hypothetical protein
MAAPRKWSDEVRAAIHTHVNEDGRAATDIGPLLEAQGLPTPPLETIRDIARATRETITDKDADEILKLVRSLRELEPLLTDTPKGNKGEKPQTMLGGLHSVPSTPETSNAEGDTPGPVSAHAAS